MYMYIYVHTSNFMCVHIRVVLSLSAQFLRAVVVGI